MSGQMRNQGAAAGGGGGSAAGVGAGGAGRQQPHRQLYGMNADPLYIVIERTAMREKIFEYMGRKQLSPQWRQQLPELVKQLEDILYTKFPNRNDYCRMLNGPIEPLLHIAIKTLIDQNQQNQQNPQVERQTSSSFSTNPVVNHDDALCEQLAASFLADMQNNNSYGRDKNDMLSQHHRMDIALSRVDHQFVMLRTAVREKIFEYIGRKPSLPEWQKPLPELARRLEEILYTKFPNGNDYYNMMKGPIEPRVQFAIKTLSTLNQQNQQKPQVVRETASSSGTITPDVNHGDFREQSASLPTDVQNSNADGLDRTE